MPRVPRDGEWEKTGQQALFTDLAHCLEQITETLKIHDLPP